MSDHGRPAPFASGPTPGPTPAPAPAPAPAGTAADVRAAGSVFAALVVIGAVLGLIWSAWSPPGPRALVLAPGLIQPDETEAWIAADGRFLVLTVLAGLLAAVLAWTRVRDRGPAMLVALAAGGLAGAALTWLVGHLTGGGTTEGKTNTIIGQLPLTLHTTGLLFLEAGVAVLVYGMLVAFAARDDLGRDDVTRDRLLAARVPAGGYPPPGYHPPSVGAGDQPQYGGGDGDAAGPLQQRDLPPQ